MPPQKEELSDRSIRAGKNLANGSPGEEVVITGLSGLFPESENIYAFRHNLFNKVDMVTNKNKRWDMIHPDIPERSGKIPNITKFDPGFFGIHEKEANIMDPMCRLVLERVVEAIYDAGVHPSELEGTRTGVFLSTTNTDCQRMLFREDLGSKNYALTGICRFTMPHRIAYHLKLKGPAYILDTACSSSLYGIDNAYKAIRNGDIDAAIVAAATVTLHPSTTLEFSKLGVLSPDGTSKTFDDSANGYARGETICAIFLQKLKDSRRVYGKIVHVFTNCDGYKEHGITHPSSDQQLIMLEEFYQQCELDPLSVDYVEAHGTGTRAGDAEEIIPIDTVFSKGRKEQLLVGSVKSNMGHSEPAAALCQIVKALIIMDTELIPPNLHFNKPRQGLEALASGRIKIVTEVTPFKANKGLISINSFGFGGSNAHCLLQWNDRKKQANGLPGDELPRLVCFSGRTEKALTSFSDDLKNRSLDAEYVALLHNIFRYDTPGHMYRGYTVISKKGQILNSQNKYEPQKSNLFLIFGDASRAFTNYSKELLLLPTFHDIIQRIDVLLTPKGISVRDTINNKKQDFLNEVLTGISLQIATFELFKLVGLVPTSSFGYSYGEFANAYANGTLTLEQAVLSAYHLTKLVSCVPKSENNTKEAVKSNKTNFEGIINNLKNHKLSDLVPEILDYAQPKSNNLKYATPEYFVDKLLNPEYISPNIQANINSILIEIGDIKKLSLNDATEDLQTNTIPLSFDNGIVPLLKTIGSLYQLGFNPDLEKLYPPVQFPVSKGTRMISPLIKWEHNKDWFVVSYNNRDQMKKTCERIVAIDVKENEWSYVSGHVIDGRNLFPATGYLFLAWETLALIHGKIYTDMKIVVENLKFIRATTVSKDSKIEFLVSIHKSSGQFEILENDVVVVTGKINIFKDAPDDQFEPEEYTKRTYNNTVLDTKDVYKELKLRGYNYSGLFQGIKKYDTSLTAGLVEWNENWISFMDNMLQTQILNITSRNLYVPTYIQRVTIDAVQHMMFCKDSNAVPVHFCTNSSIIKSGGIEIRGLQASAITRKKTLGQPVLEKYIFVPNEANNLTVEQSVRVNMQIALENNYRLKVKILEIPDEEIQDNQSLLAPIIFEVLGDQPLIHADVTIFTQKPLEFDNIKVSNKSFTAEDEALLIVLTNGLSRPKVLDEAFKSLTDNGYILSRESLSFDASCIQNEVEILTIHTTEFENFVLFTKRKQLVPFRVVNVTDTFSFDWFNPLQEAVKSDDKNGILVISKNDSNNGILGLVNCIRREPTGHETRCVILQEDGLPDFNLDNNFYGSQLRKGLAINVFKNGKWGTYRHLLLETIGNVESEHCFVNLATRGDLSSFKWYQGPINTKQQTGIENELVYVYYSALNFKDIMIATGKLQLSQKDTEYIQGLEFSGKDSSGQRVMGFSPGALATLVQLDRRVLIPVPENWTLEDAATVPVVYGTVLYGLVKRGDIKRGQSILIHAGSGGIGQAAINIALHYGCNIFTTVGTKEKREFIKKHFPTIKDSQIGNSRDTSFEQLIHKQTKGKGVDLVLNSLAEEKLQASLRCLSKGGKFIEIGKFDLMNENPLYIELFKKNASFHGAHLDYFFNTDISKTYTIINLIKNGIKNGSVKPLIRTCFEEDEIESAFRFMASGKHIGKVLINIRKEGEKQKIQPTIKKITGIPRYYCEPRGSYVIIGGLGGFGLELADWLVKRGAKKLVLASRKGVKTGYQAHRINTWRSEGTTVQIFTDSVRTKEGCQSLLRQANAIGPVAGIFNLAVVLLDALLENQTVENFVESLEPKAKVTMLLDELSREMCPGLRDFVVFSSVSCGRGNAGQTNYGMANSIMERICEKRKNEGFPALAIQWGAVGDVGLVAEMQNEDKVLEIGGTLQQRISSCIDVMDEFMQQKEAVVSSIVVAEKRSATGSADNVVDCVANIIGVRDIKTISVHSTLPELGMDSMMASEIKQILEREFDIFLTPEGVRSLTFAKLHQIMSDKESAKLEINGKESPPNTAQEIITEKHILKLSNSKGDVCKNVVILLPGIEGDLSLMETISNNLQAEVWGAQYYQYHTVEEATKKLWPDVKELVSAQTRFQLVGHSFGTLVALELAVMLEKEGFTGIIILIDGSPKTSVEFTKQVVGKSSNVSKLEVKILATIASNMLPPRESHDIMKVVQKCNTLEDRLDTLSNYVANVRKIEFQMVRDRLYGIYMRTVATMDYKPSYGNTKIKSIVKLFRPKEFITMANIENDYGLSEFVERDVEVCFFNGNHMTVLQDPYLSEAIDELIC